MYNLFLFIVASSFSTAFAFPTGSYTCGSGDTTVSFDIESVRIGSDLRPKVNVVIDNPELTSKLEGVGLLVEITDKKTGEIDRRMKLPGTNFEMRYEKDDKIEFVGLANTGKNRCRKN